MYVREILDIFPYPQLWTLLREMFSQ